MDITCAVYHYAQVFLGVVMGYRLTIAVCAFLIPLLMIVFGLVLALYSSRNMNAFFGYRSRISVMSEKAWRFANMFAGVLWAATGMLFTAGNIFIYRYALSQGDMTVEMSVYMMVQILVLIAVNYPVRKALSRNFDREGRRK